jgi:hypothetical protein
MVAEQVSTNSNGVIVGVAMHLNAAQSYWS